MKVCKSCKQEKPLSEFYFKRTINFYETRCKPCFIERKKFCYKDVERTRKTKAVYRKKSASEVRAYISLQKEKPCMDCGKSYPPCVMDFDHVRGEKKERLSKISSSFKKAKEEILKCELVCSNCHRLRTQKRIDAKKILNI